MEKPRGDGLDFPVNYLVDFHAGTQEEKGARLHLQRRALLRDHDVTVNVSIPLSADEECQLLVRRDHNHGRTVSTTMAASYPLEPSMRGEYKIPHPFFTFRLPGQHDAPGRLVQWQVHPAPNSLFRYVLVDLGKVSGNQGPAPYAKPDSHILAIYQHVGIVVWLPVDFSEGVLLLPEEDSSISHEQEAVIVASLLSFLWQLRGVSAMQPQSMRRGSGSLKMLKRVVSLVQRR